MDAVAGRHAGWNYSRSRRFFTTNNLLRGREAEALARLPDALPGSGSRGAPPYLASFKMAGDYLPFDAAVSFVVRSLPGLERSILWSVPRSAFDAVGGGPSRCGCG